MLVCLHDKATGSEHYVEALVVKHVKSGHRGTEVHADFIVVVQESPEEVATKVNQAIMLDPRYVGPGAPAGLSTSGDSTGISGFIPGVMLGAAMAAGP